MELIMFVGIPASGKSTRSAAYRDMGYLVLSSDEIRAGMTGGVEQDNLTEKERGRINRQVFEAIRKRAAEALNCGQSVVVDATNLGRKRRMTFLKQFERFDCVKKCVLFITPVERCMERNRKRTGVARVPDDAMQKMLCNFECPNYWEGWDEIVPVAADEEYAFPFEAIRGLDQDNPHHSLTLDEHMAAAVRFCREHGCGEALQRVAAYHDVGKLYTRKYNHQPGRADSCAHYRGHDSYGAYLYLTEMCCGKTLSPDAFRQVLHETNLINCHMRPLVHWNWENSTEENDRRLFGEEFIADLLILHQADRAAH